MNDFASNPSYKCLGKGINITLTRWGTKNKEIREIKHQQKNQPQNNKAWTCFTFFSDLEAFAVPQQPAQQLGLQVSFPKSW